MTLPTTSAAPGTGSRLGTGIRRWEALALSVDCQLRSRPECPFSFPCRKLQGSPSPPLTNSAAMSRAVLRNRPKGFWLHVPRKTVDTSRQGFKSAYMDAPVLSGVSRVQQGSGIAELPSPPQGPTAVTATATQQQQQQQNTGNTSAGGSGSAGRGGTGPSSSSPTNPGLSGASGLLETMPRREAVCIKLRSGHIVVFGGNDGRWTDISGDGDHQYGLEDTLIMDVEALQEYHRFIEFRQGIYLLRGPPAPIIDQDNHVAST